MIGEGGKCTTACLRSLSREEEFRFRIGRGVEGGGGEGELGTENIGEYELGVKGCEAEGLLVGGRMRERGPGYKREGILAVRGRGRVNRLLTRKQIRKQIAFQSAHSVPHPDLRFG